MLSTAINACCSLPVLPLVKVDTEWTVITGAPSSGKSTLIRDLRVALPDYSVMPDEAREVIERGLGWRGPGGEQISLDDILRSQRLQDTVFAGKWLRHCEASPQAPHLLDYALPDVIAFSRNSGLVTTLFEERAGLFRYKQVFVLEPLDYAEDAARNWTKQDRDQLLGNIINVYAGLGFSFTRVPVLPPEERRDFVLRHMGQLA